MPRALPWLTDGAAKKDKVPVKKAKPVVRHESAAASDDDIVNFDLDIISKPPAQERKKPEKKRIRASSSSPPPPGPPPIETMKPGFAADDIFMMVEDEFYSTAQLYTGHIHHAEYARLKKLHKSRGQETLAGLGRGTDGRTEQSKALRMKLESLDLAKKQRKTLRELKGVPDVEEDADGSEAEDEYMQDPHLSGLMRASQMGASQDLTGLMKPKANTRAAAGLSQSPYKTARTRDAIAEEMQQSQRRTMSQIDEREDDSDDLDAYAFGESHSSHRSGVVSTLQDSETDDDDLDAGVPSVQARAVIPVRTDKVIASSSKPTTVVKTEVRQTFEPRPFAKFAQKAEKRSSSKAVATELHKAPSPKREAQIKNVSRYSVASEKMPSPRDTQPVTRPPPPRENDCTSRWARKRAERKAAEAERKTVKKEDIDDIPTFLF